MKLTKFQHACVVVEDNSTTALIDLGTFTHDFIAPKHLDIIIVTHDHPDHFDEPRIRALLEAHPQATLVAHESISGKFTDYNTIAAVPGEPITVAGMTLQYFGGEHASIAPSIPTPPNLGVLINNRFYYPGDSFALPTIPIEVLALPVSAPWLRLNDTFSFLTAVKPTVAFPTHDAILSNEGKALVDRMIGPVAASCGTTYKRLDEKSITIS